MVWAIATICARLASTFAPWCRNTFTTPTPLVVCDSMCSMLLTVAVMARSKEPTMRPSISSEGSPV
jgi:hypothetical protein